MAPNRFRKAVKRHTERNGRGSHFEKDSEGIRTEITYTLFDCRHCEEENNVASKADFDTWDEVWPSVREHLKSEHPDEIVEEDPEYRPAG